MEDDRLTRFAVLIAVHVHRYAGIVIERGQQVRKIAPVVEVRQAPAGISPAGHGVDPRDALDAGEQMHKQVAGDALSVFFEAAPAEESHRVERHRRRIAQKRLPIDGLRAGVRRNRIDPGSRWRIAVRVALDQAHFA